VLWLYASLSLNIYSLQVFASRQAVLQAAQRDAGSPTPNGVDELAEMIPDVKQHTSAARLIRRLLHPLPSQRPTAQQALDHDFLQTDA